MIMMAQHREGASGVQARDSDGMSGSGGEECDDRA